MFALPLTHAAFQGKQPGYQKRSAKKKNKQAEAEAEAEADMEDELQEEDEPQPRTSAPVPPPPQATGATKAPAAEQARSAPPASNNNSDGSGFHHELTENDENPLELPHHLLTWQNDELNNHLTLLVYLPQGTTAGQLNPRIDSGGESVSVEFVWPVSMLTEMVPMFIGSTNNKKVYDKGHVKITSFRKSVQQFRCFDSARPVKSVFRKELPFPVEEQFTDQEVPHPVSLARVLLSSGGVAPCLILEMMGLRSNYKRAAKIVEVTYDLSQLSLDDY